MTWFTTRTTGPPPRERGLKHPRLPVSAVFIGSIGVLNCASVIVTLIMAG